MTIWSQRSAHQVLPVLAACEVMAIAARATAVSKRGALD
jgi:hypothetical protein